MSIVLLLIGAFLCSLSIVALAYWIGFYLGPENEDVKINDLGIMWFILSVVGTSVTGWFLEEHYKDVFEYPQALWYIVLGSAVAIMTGPVAMLVGVIADVSIRSYRYRKYSNYN